MRIMYACVFSILTISVIIIEIPLLLAELQCLWQTNPKRFLRMNNEHKIPRIGFGTGQMKGEQLERTLHEVLLQGYRNIDTAPEYENEQNIAKLVQTWYGNITRRLLFITTKLPLYANRPEMVEKYVTQSLRKLNLRHIDMFLIQAPFGIKENEYHEDESPVIDYDTNITAIWQAMEMQYNYRTLRGIGLSNFNASQLTRILKHGTIVPALLQIELHAYLQQKELIKLCKKHGIIVQAYATLGSKETFETLLKNKKTPLDLFENEVVLDVAKRNNKTAPQILLRHMIQQDISVLIKSADFEHIAENTDVINYKLPRTDMAAFDQLDKGEDARIFTFKEMIKGIETHPEYPFRTGEQSEK